MAMVSQGNGHRGDSVAGMRAVPAGTGVVLSVMCCRVTAEPQRQGWDSARGKGLVQVPLGLMSKQAATRVWVLGLEHLRRGMKSKHGYS